MQDLVSVCMCTCNSSLYIRDTLKSVLDQTYTNMEILILDNWSLDNTCDIINSFNDMRITLYKMSKNVGAYVWLNYLLDRANWKYVAIQDHDDIRLKTKIEKQVYFLNKNLNYVGCWTRTCMWFEYDWKCYDRDFGVNSTYVIHPSLMFRNCLKRYDPDRTYMADCYFMQEILCGWKKLMFNIPEVLTIHRIRSWLWNYSYNWFKLNRLNLSTLFKVHNFFYAFLVLGFELFRKIFYSWIQERRLVKIERLPFILMWYKIYNVKNKFRFLYSPTSR